MWSKFYISQEQVSCDHFVDEERSLWFINDFPHLIKNVRNWIPDKCTRVFETLDGKVKLSHWEEVFKAEDNPVFYKLTEHHLQHKLYQKMSVELAYQLFDEKIVDAMEMYRDNGSEWPETALSDYKLILAISFRSSKGALRLVHSSTERKDIEEFLCYLILWKSMLSPVKRPAKKRQRASYDSEATKSTVSGETPKKRRCSAKNSAVPDPKVSGKAPQQTKEVGNEEAIMIAGNEQPAMQQIKEKEEAKAIGDISK